MSGEVPNNIGMLGGECVAAAKQCANRTGKLGGESSAGQLGGREVGGQGEGVSVLYISYYYLFYYWVVISNISFTC